MATFAFDEFLLDDSQMQLSHRGRLLRVGPQALEVLAHLLRNPGRVVTKAELISECWEGRVLSENVLSVCVARLRKALGSAADRCISNAYGRGYRFSGAVTVLPKVETSAETPRPSRRKPPTLEPMVGRASAFGRLQAGLARAEAGRGGVCALLGEAGIGKTRAAEELAAEAAAAGFLVSWGRCHAFGETPPLWAWLQIGRSCESQLPGALRGKSLEALMSGTSSVELTPRGPAAWDRTVDWLQTVVCRVTAQRAWLVLLEDVHWADAATLTLLSQLVAEISQRRMFVVMTARDTELPADAGCQGALRYLLGHRNGEVIQLERLREVDVEAYLTCRFGAAGRSLVAPVFVNSEGNPFFMVEQLRPWVSGAVPTPDALTLSGHALEIIRQGLRRLDARALELLSIAAVIGRSFDLGLLSFISQHSVETLLEVLHAALESNVIVAQRGSHAQFQFGHELIRRALYDELPTARRARLHLRVAEALQAREPLAGAFASAQLAHHLLEASPCGDVARAIEAARKAVAAAVRVGAYADACSFLRRSLDVLRLRSEAVDPRQLCWLLYELAICERAAGESGFSQHFNEAIRLAREHGVVDVLYVTGRRMSRTPWAVAMPGAGDVLEAALVALPASDHERRAILLAHLAWTPPHGRNAGEVEALLAEADTHAERAGVGAKRAVLRARLYYAGSPDDHERARAISAQLEAITLERDPLSRALGSVELLVDRVMGLTQRCEFNAAAAALDAYRAAVEQAGHAELRWHYERARIVAIMNAGKFAEARTRLAELKCRAERLELGESGTVFAIDWAELTRQTDQVRPLDARSVLALSPSSADNANVHTAKLRVLAQLGLLDEVRAALQQLEPARLHELPRSRDYLAQLANLAVAAAATGERAHAETLYELLEPYADCCVASLSLYCHGIVAHFLGLLAHSCGQRARARKHFAEAIRLQKRFHLSLPLARSRYELGSSLLESRVRGEREKGRRLLLEVHDFAATHGLAPLQAAAKVRLPRNARAAR